MKIEKVQNLVTNLHDKTEYVIHIENLKQALNHGLVLIKINRVIKFLDINTKLRQKLMKDELGGQIMKEFVGVRAKTYSYLKDNND